METPPSNHPDFEIPGLSAVNKNARIAELDNHLAFLRTYYGPGADDGAAKARHDRRVMSRMATREAVLAFMNDGLCPHEPEEFLALLLFLVRNDLPDALSWLVVQTGIGPIDLQNCKLGTQEIGMLADWLKNIPFQIQLDLSNNQIDSSGAALLADALSANTITHLELGNNPLNDEGMQALATALRGNTSLESLALYNTGLQNSGIEVLASVLDTHPALAVLVLDSNPFDDQGAASLASVLGRNKTLFRLSVQHSELSDVGLSYLAGALALNNSLKALQLSTNSEEPYVHFPYALANALLVNQSLTHLLVFAAAMPEAATEQLAAAVAVNTTLRAFALRLSPYKLSEINAAMARQIGEKAHANGLIADAGLALFELSQLPESAVPIPQEIGYQIAAFSAQIAEDNRRGATLQVLAGSGPLGAGELGDGAESKTGGA